MRAKGGQYKKTGAHIYASFSITISDFAKWSEVWSSDHYL